MTCAQLYFRIAMDKFPVIPVAPLPTFELEYLPIIIYRNVIIVCWI